MCLHIQCYSIQYKTIILTNMVSCLSEEHLYLSDYIYVTLSRIQLDKNVYKLWDE